jgi:hypothetical protein
LGRDTLGRIIRKRNLSPEVKENRRRLIAEARQKKLEKIQAEAVAKHILATTPPKSPAAV